MATYTWQMRPAAKECSFCGLPFIAFTVKQRTCSEACCFWSKVERGHDDDCWLWQAAKTRGYGVFCFPPVVSAMAHRVSWFLHHGEIPRFACVLHKCDVRACVNPNHLFLGSYYDNIHDMRDKGRFRKPWEASAIPASVVRRLFELHNLGMTRKAISATLKVAYHSVVQILLGRRWVDYGHA